MGYATRLNASWPVAGQEAPAPGHAAYLGSSSLAVTLSVSDGLTPSSKKLCS